MAITSTKSPSDKIFLQFNPISLMPVFAVLVGMVMLLGIERIFQVGFQLDSYPLIKRSFAYDYKEFQLASSYLARDENPYLVWRYVTPPLPAILLRPLNEMSVQSASTIIYVAILLSMLVAILLSVGHYFELRSKEGSLLILGMVLITGLSYPFLFLLDRENIDSFVQLMLVAGFFFWGRRKDWFAGICFAVALSLKIYPALVLLPIAAFRKKHILVAMVVAQIILMSWTLKPWWWFVSGPLLSRASFFTIEENGSIVMPFYFAARGIEWFFQHLGVGTSIQGGLAGIAFILFGVLLASVFGMDWMQGKSISHTEQHERSIQYLPFMVAVPSLVYHYEFIIFILFIPSLCRMAQVADRIVVKGIIGLGILGSLLTQFPVAEFQYLLSEALSHFSITSGSRVTHAVPSIGLWMILVMVFLWKMKNSNWAFPLFFQNRRVFVWEPSVKNDLRFALSRVRRGVLGSG